MGAHVNLYRTNGNPFKSCSKPEFDSRGSEYLRECGSRISPGAAGCFRCWCAAISITTIMIAKRIELVVAKLVAAAAAAKSNGRSS